MSQDYKCFIYILFFFSVNMSRDGIIDNVISLIRGGTPKYAYELKEKLLKGAKTVDVTDFVNWATSLSDAPVLVNQKVRHVYCQIEDFYIFLLNVTVGSDEQLTSSERDVRIPTHSSLIPRKKQDREERCDSCHHTNPGWVWVSAF